MNGCCTYVRILRSVLAYLVRFLPMIFCFLNTFIAQNPSCPFFCTKQTSPKLPLPKTMCAMKSSGIIFLDQNSVSSFLLTSIELWLFIVCIGDSNPLDMLFLLGSRGVLVLLLSSSCFFCNQYYQSLFSLPDLSVLLIYFFNGADQGLFSVSLRSFLFAQLIIFLFALNLSLKFLLSCESLSLSTDFSVLIFV